MLNSERTLLKFKVGDKVHVLPQWPTSMHYCIRAVITDVDDCYHLKAFLQDLPGVWMFNIYDKDLIPRINKKRIPTPKERMYKT